MASLNSARLLAVQFHQWKSRDERLVTTLGSAIDDDNDPASSKGPPVHPARFEVLAASIGCVTLGNDH